MANPKATNSTQVTKGNKEVMEEEVLPYALYQNGEWRYINIANNKQAQKEVKERLQKQIAGLQRRIHYIDTLGRR